MSGKGNWYDNLSNGIKDDTAAIWSAFTWSSSSTVDGARRGSDVMSINSQDNNNDSTNKTIFNKGFSDIEKQKAVAINEYDIIHRKYNDLSNKIKNSTESTSLKDELNSLETQLVQKRNKLDEISKKFNSYQGGDFNRLTDSITPGNGNNKDSKSVNTDVVAGQSVYGWGETAQQLGQEEIEANLHLSNDPSEAQRRLDELRKITKNGWFTFNNELASSEQKMAENAANGLRGWGESAEEFSREELKDLQNSMNKLKNSTSDHLDGVIKKLNDAEKDLKQSQSSSWWSKQSENDSLIHDNAVKNYDLAKQEYDKAMKDFDQMGNKIAPNQVSTK